MLYKYDKNDIIMKAQGDLGFFLLKGIPEAVESYYIYIYYCNIYFSNDSATGVEGDEGVERVMEIVNYVMKLLIDQGKHFGSEKHLTQELVALGYQLTEIEDALKLLYSMTSTLRERIEPGATLGRIHEGFRIFSPSEETRFSLAFRSEVMRMAASEAVTKEEIEMILLEAYLLDSKEIGLKELDQILHKVIKDEERLLIIAPQLVMQTPVWLLN